MSNAAVSTSLLLITGVIKEQRKAVNCKRLAQFTSDSQYFSLSRHIMTLMNRVELLFKAVIVSIFM